jgi:hypothetical protein
MFIGQFGGPATIIKHGAGRFCPNIKKPATPINPVAPLPSDPKGGKNALECKRFHTKEEGMRSASKCHPYDFQVVKSTCVVGFFLGKLRTTLQVPSSCLVLCQTRHLPLK